MNNEAENVLKKVCLIKIAIAMHLRNYRVVRQIESSKPQPAQRFAPEGILWLAGKARGLSRAGGGLLGGGLLWV
jgi:hypothetical protein